MADVVVPGSEQPGQNELLSRLMAQQEAQANVIAQFGQALNNLTGTMNSFSESIKGGLNVNAPAPKEPEIDLTNASMGDLAQFILKEVGKMVTVVKEDTTKQIDSLRLDNARQTRLSEFEKTKGMKGNEDMDEWLPEMRDLATNNPNLSMQQLLNLARQENPTKAEKIRAKRDEEHKAANPEPPDESFGGLTPTSQPSFDMSKSGERKKVSLSEALNKAWNDVVPAPMKKEATVHDPLF